MSRETAAASHWSQHHIRISGDLRGLDCPDCPTDLTAEEEAGWRGDPAAREWTLGLDPNPGEVHPVLRVFRQIPAAPRTSIDARGSRENTSPGADEQQECPSLRRELRTSVAPGTLPRNPVPFITSCLLQL
ncbi:hypothetical protein NDU88_009836 [Pleurodeles waltl]|uniref:Uncharacterized protein n=1 Tax=Pleurodeles waltl TaxID=8319 RepID=A0AAV7RZK1_PLEWA|nr:hypothetical protein NDU88_009836 [Pleurodeles waltl]